MESELHSRHHHSNELSIGDLYLAGSPIEGYFFGKKSGHYLNNELLKKLFSDKNNFEYIH